MNFCFFYETLILFIFSLFFSFLSLYLYPLPTQLKIVTLKGSETYDKTGVANWTKKDKKITEKKNHEILKIPFLIQSQKKSKNLQFSVK